MVRGDFRFRPRYIFWSSIIAFVIRGAVLGWFVSRDHIKYMLDSLPSGLAGLTVAVWLNRRGGLTNAGNNAESYEHPILGLYFGLPAIITLILLDESWTYALLAGLVSGLILTVATVAFRRWRTRNDSPNRRRPIPTLTGWR